MVRDPATDCDRFVEDPSRAAGDGGFHFDCELVDERIERYHLAAPKISLE